DKSFLKDLVDETPFHEVEDYRDIDDCARRSLTFLYRHVQRGNTARAKTLIAQFSAWKWLLRHPDEDLLISFAPKQALDYLYNQIVITDTWSRYTKDAALTTRGGKLRVL